jgi:hypothetical protein
VESNWVHTTMRPPVGLSCVPRVIMMENLVEWWLAGETEVLGENLPQCHFVHHKPHMLYPDENPRPRVGKPATNRLSYGTALLHFPTVHLGGQKTNICVCLRNLQESDSEIISQQIVQITSHYSIQWKLSSHGNSDSLTVLCKTAAQEPHSGNSNCLQVSELPKH